MLDIIHILRISKGLETNFGRTGFSEDYRLIRSALQRQAESYSERIGQSYFLLFSMKTILLVFCSLYIDVHDLYQYLRVGTFQTFVRNAYAQKAWRKSVKETGSTTKERCARSRCCTIEIINTWYNQKTCFVRRWMTGHA